MIDLKILNQYLYIIINFVIPRYYRDDPHI